jgi:hypothetical protein
MSKQPTHSLDGFLEMLEKRSRAARAISITITLVTIMLAALALFFTIREVRKQINLEKASLETIRQQKMEAQKQLDEARQQLEVIQPQLNVFRNALEQIPEAKRDALLTKAQQEVSLADPQSPRVYLQILNNNQRDQAKVIMGRLKGNGFNVQGIELVRAQISGLKQTQVRYFRPEHSDKAQKIVTLLNQSGVHDATAILININVAQSQIEVWFSADALPAATAAPSAPATEQTRLSAFAGQLTDQAPSAPATEPTPVGGKHAAESTAFVVIANRKTLQEAEGYASELKARGLPYPIEIYRRDESRFYITLGGYLSNAEARRRVAYAKQTGLSKGAYQSNKPDLGENLFK